MPRSNAHELLHGTLDALVLKTLSWGPRHGFAVIRWLEETTEEELQIEEGSLYPALYRLEHQALIASEWGQSDNNRRAKYYTLTREGRRALKHEAAQWERLASAISLIVRHA